MSPVPDLDRQVGVFLANMCRQAYIQHLRKGEFLIPEGFKLVTPLSITPLPGLSPELYGFILQSPTHVVISFRGSQTIQDWVSDLNVRQMPWPYSENAGRVHSGFLSMYASCRDQILNALSQLPPTSKLYITGHSLGGALAELCAFDLSVNTPFSDLLMYNFGSPRSGNWQFARAYNKKVKNSIRLIIKQDLIPKLPPILVTTSPPFQFWFYVHVDREWLLPLETSPTKATHDLDTYLQGLGYIPNVNP